MPSIEQRKRLELPARDQGRVLVISDDSSPRTLRRSKQWEWKSLASPLVRQRLSRYKNAAPSGCRKLGRLGIE